MAFARLRNRIEYSLDPGMVEAREMVAWAADLDMDAVAVTDDGTMASVAELPRSHAEKGGEVE